MEHRFNLPSTVYFSHDAIKGLSRLTGKKAFIVTDAIMGKLGYLDTAIGHLERTGMSCTVFSDVRPDPDVSLIAKGLASYMESAADVLVALGGGSAIDTAKAILYFAMKADPNMIRPKFVAIPSTSGTGSEVTNFSVVTSGLQKLVIVDDLITPDIAILDDTCIQHVPPAVIADTGMDVLVHAIEAYVSRHATVFTDALAEKAIHLIFTHLRDLHADPGNDVAREHILNASCMAGMAFTNANLGITHSLAHALGATFHIPHGRSNALLMSAVIAYNAHLPSDAGFTCPAAMRYGKLATLDGSPGGASGIGSPMTMDGPLALLNVIETLKRDLGIPTSIRCLGIPEKDFMDAIPDMVEKAMMDRCTPANPRIPTRDHLSALYKACY